MLQVITLTSLNVLLIVYDVYEIDYHILNMMTLSLNSLAVLCFLVTFFFLNFKMTGIMLASPLNDVIKRVYKLLLILLVSRIVSLTFEVVLTVYIKTSISAFIASIEDGDYVVFALIFILAILIVLLA